MFILIHFKSEQHETSANFFKDVTIMLADHLKLFTSYLFLS